MQVPKASKPLIQTLADSYLQQLYTLQMQIQKQQTMLPMAMQSSELPYVQQQYQTALNNLQEQIYLCEKLRNM